MHPPKFNVVHFHKQQSSIFTVCVGTTFHCFVHCITTLRVSQGFCLDFRRWKKFPASPFCGQHIFGKLHHNHWGRLQNSHGRCRRRASQTSDLGYGWSGEIQNYHIYVRIFSLVVNSNYLCFCCSAGTTEERMVWLLFMMLPMESPLLTLRGGCTR